ncbi:MAG: hypothetical protein KKD66_14885 [Proteobacteria bacterium]|nr:hypothetical protein [Pseudomonadota bacterium]
MAKILISKVMETMFCFPVECAKESPLRRTGMDTCQSTMAIKITMDK